MANESSPSLHGDIASPLPPILDSKQVKNCHICLPDTPRPIGAIQFGGHFYSYVKFFSDLDAAQRGAGRLMQRGNVVVLTRVTKGLVLWVLEPDAQLAAKGSAQYQ